MNSSLSFGSNEIYWKCQRKWNHLLTRMSLILSGWWEVGKCVDTDFIFFFIYKMSYSRARLVTECSQLLKGGWYLFYSLCFHCNYCMAETINYRNPHSLSFSLSFLVGEPQLLLGNQTPSPLVTSNDHLIFVQDVKRSVLWKFWKNSLKRGCVPFASHSISLLPGI